MLPVERAEKQQQYGDTVAGRFYECLRTMHEMLSDRGYEVGTLPSFDSVSFALRHIDLADSSRAQGIMDKYELTVRLKHDERSTLRVFWLCGKIGVNSDSMKRIEKIFETDEDESSQLPTTIVLVQCEGSDITAPARKVAEKLPVVVEIFDSQELRRNVTKTRLQPKFALLSQAEKEAVKQKYCAKDHQLPQMSWTDPIRRYYGLRPGEIVRCKRVGEAEAYRIVLPPSVGKKK